MAQQPQPNATPTIGHTDQSINEHFSPHHQRQISSQLDSAGFNEAERIQTPKAATVVAEQLAAPMCNLTLNRTSVIANKRQIELESKFKSPSSDQISHKKENLRQHLQSSSEAKKFCPRIVQQNTSDRKSALQRSNSALCLKEDGWPSPAQQSNPFVTHLSFSMLGAGGTNSRDVETDQYPVRKLFNNPSPTGSGESELPHTSAQQQMNQSSGEKKENEQQNEPKLPQLMNQTTMLEMPQSSESQQKQTSSYSANNNILAPSNCLTINRDVLNRTSTNEMFNIGSQATTPLSKQLGVVESFVTPTKDLLPASYHPTKTSPHNSSNNGLSFGFTAPLPPRSHSHHPESAHHHGYQGVGNQTPSNQNYYTGSMIHHHNVQHQINNSKENNVGDSSQFPWNNNDATPLRPTQRSTANFNQANNQSNAHLMPPPGGLEYSVVVPKKSSQNNNMNQQQLPTTHHNYDNSGFYAPPGPPAHHHGHSMHPSSAHSTHHPMTQPSFPPLTSHRPAYHSQNRDCSPNLQQPQQHHGGYYLPYHPPQHHHAPHGQYGGPPPGYALHQHPGGYPLPHRPQPVQCQQGPDCTSCKRERSIHPHAPPQSTAAVAAGSSQHSAQQQAAAYWHHHYHNHHNYHHQQMMHHLYHAHYAQGHGHHMGQQQQLQHGGAAYASQAGGHHPQHAHAHAHLHSGHHSQGHHGGVVGHHQQHYGAGLSIVAPNAKSVYHQAPVAGQQTQNQGQGLSNNSQPVQQQVSHSSGSDSAANPPQNDPKACSHQQKTVIHKTTIKNQGGQEITHTTTEGQQVTASGNGQVECIRYKHQQVVHHQHNQQQLPQSNCIKSNKNSHQNHQAPLLAIAQNSQNSADSENSDPIANQKKLADFKKNNKLSDLLPQNADMVKTEQQNQRKKTVSIQQQQTNKIDSNILQPVVLNNQVFKKDSNHTPNLNLQPTLVVKNSDYTQLPLIEENDESSSSSNSQDNQSSSRKILNMDDSKAEAPLLPHELYILQTETDAKNRRKNQQAANNELKKHTQNIQNYQHGHHHPQNVNLDQIQNPEAGHHHHHLNQHLSANGSNNAQGGATSTVSLAAVGMIQSPGSESSCMSGQQQRIGAGGYQAGSMYNTNQQANVTRRGFYFNNESKQWERIIRKRKRKNVDQLSTLNEQFDINPHWSKETLEMISHRTGLTLGQVYKWGWDQKRKKFGVEEAERMRHIEHQMDQANAARRSQQLVVSGAGSINADLNQNSVHFPLQNERTFPAHFMMSNELSDNKENRNMQLPEAMQIDRQITVMDIQSNQSEVKHLEDKKMAAPEPKESCSQNRLEETSSIQSSNQKYQTPIQQSSHLRGSQLDPYGGNTFESRQKKLLSTQPESIQKPQTRISTANTGAGDKTEFSKEKSFEAPTEQVQRKRDTKVIQKQSQQHSASSETAKENKLKQKTKKQVPASSSTIQLPLAAAEQTSGESKVISKRVLRSRQL